MAETLTVGAWLVHDSGLVTAPGPFRRLAGSVRHHQGRGDPWPARVRLSLTATELVVDEVGRWPRSAVQVRVVAPGPPVTFVLDVPGTAQLLAAPAGEATGAFIAALAPASA